MLVAVDSIVFDAMAIVQTIQPPPSPIVSTYNDMALIFWKYVFNNSKSIESIHVVFDRYDENSLKSQTREKRGELIDTHALSHIQGHMKIGDWKKVLVSTKSKGEVTALFTKYIAEHANDFLSDSQHLYVSGGLKEKALKIDRACVSFVSQLTLKPRRSRHKNASSCKIYSQSWC